MRRTLRGFTMLAGALALLAGSACKATPPTNFYVLTSLADAETGGDASRSETGPVLGVGPVEIPSYLDQPEIVTRSAGNTVSLSEFHQWAEPLQDGITRVLAEDLSQRLPLDRVALFPWKRAVEVDVQVLVRFARFEVADGAARLVAEWELLDGAGAEVLARRSSFSQPVSGSGHVGKVAALSAVLARLSGEIAGAIEETNDG